MVSQVTLSILKLEFCIYYFLEYFYISFLKTKNKKAVYICILILKREFCILNFRVYFCIPLLKNKIKIALYIWCFIALVYVIKCSLASSWILNQPRGVSISQSVFGISIQARWCIKVIWFYAIKLSKPQIKAMFDG